MNTRSPGPQGRAAGCARKSSAGRAAAVTASRDEAVDQVMNGKPNRACGRPSGSATRPEGMEQR